MIKESKTFFNFNGESIMKLNLPQLVVLASALALTPNSFAQSNKPKSKVVLARDVEWEQLNPARGDASPGAATLWGDRKGTVATGFLVRFVDGFSSPPHIHNVSYRGIVITGGIHNDDPNATPMWMPPGSFWTQPAGEVHITASEGAGVAYIEIEQGPYLVLPTEQASDNGERPVNVTPSNFVWLDETNTSWIKRSAKKTDVSEGAEIAFLWGSPRADQLNGTLVKLPAGFVGELSCQSKTFKAVVIEGKTNLQLPNASKLELLTPGSYVSSEGDVTHQVRCDDGEDCLIYIRSNGKFTILQE